MRHGPRTAHLVADERYFWADRRDDRSGSGRPYRDDLIRLGDGRALAYAQSGDPRGAPVFFFGGILHSRLWSPDDEATLSAGVRLITVDRPGYGRSDVQPGTRSAPGRRMSSSWRGSSVWSASPSPAGPRGAGMPPPALPSSPTA
jgi:hypothetical protein